jgi:hypothetical protein
MSSLIRNNWPWELLAFVLGALITWLLLNRRSQPATAPAVRTEEPAEERVLVTVGAPAEPVEDQQTERQQTARTERQHTQPEAVSEPEPLEPPVEPMPRVEPVQPVASAFSQRMEAPVLFDETVELAAIDGDGEPADEVRAGAAVEVRDVPAGRFGPGSADAVAHQGPPDGFTIKGNAQSMLFHTPDSPYYGRTKPQVWFRTEADAENAGFTKYARKPRRSPGTR